MPTWGQMDVQASGIGYPVLTDTEAREEQCSVFEEQSEDLPFHSQYWMVCVLQEVYLLKTKTKCDSRNSTIPSEMHVIGNAWSAFSFEWS